MANLALGNLTQLTISVFIYNYCLLPQKKWSLLIFEEQSEAFGVTITQIASNMGRNETPKTLSESHESLPQGNPAAVSDILRNP